MLGLIHGISLVNTERFAIGEQISKDGIFLSGAFIASHEVHRWEIARLRVSKTDTGEGIMFGERSLEETRKGCSGWWW